MTPKKAVKTLWIFFLTGFLSFCIVFLAVYFNFFGWFGEIPDFEILENPKSELASEVYSSDNVLLGKYYSTNRSKVEFDGISKNVVKALIATEDSRFVDHSGVDFRATIRVLSKFGGAGGGSTITQQLAKNLFKMRTDSIYACNIGGPMRMIAIKIKEWTTAKRLEAAYTKKEIITMYLNTVDFGRGAVGIKSAANIFFDKDPKDLNLQEAAILVGKLKATHKYDPISNPENSFDRRNQVFYQMTQYGPDENSTYLTRTEYDSLKEIPLQVNYTPQNYHTGLAAYFRAFLKNELKKLQKKELQAYNFNTDGLKIYTTINYQLQQHAEKSVHDHMNWLQSEFNKNWRGKEPWERGYIERKTKLLPEYRVWKKEYEDNPDSLDIMLNLPRKTKVFTFDQGSVDTVLSPIEELKYHSKFLRCAMVSIDPHTGHIKAWVGGVNHEHFSYDNVAQGKRQVGSTMKPILYSAAINKGYSPCTRVLDAPVTIYVGDRSWTPRNSRMTGKMVTLKWAMAKSINNIAAWVIKEIGPQALIDHARDLGITCSLDSTVSLALGTSDIPLKQMVSAYCTFADGGFYRTPIFIERIEDRNGKVIYTPEAYDENRVVKSVMTPENAYKMLTMLRYGTQIGTSYKLASQYGLLRNGNHIGGKTGTTQNSADGLFIGVSRDLVTGIWVGGEEPHIHFRNGRIGQGAVMAMPIFGNYMVKAYADKKTGIKKGPFFEPSGISAEDVVCEPDENPIAPEGFSDDENEDDE